MIEQIVIRLCQIVPRERIKDFSVPFSLLYGELAKAKEITPLSGLANDEKIKYWNATTGNRFQRHIQCQALYLFDLITQKK